ncbi:MAG: RNA polymerase sigma factor [bacterium]|nr:RNA polymerase sigma factor [bacterium]
MADSYSDSADRADVTPSDEDLVALAREGRQDAFGQLVKRYEGRLFNYIRRMVSSAADAEDLFQDTFLKVYSNLDRFRTGAPFRPWVYRIATNTCRDHLRRSRYRRTVPLNGGSDAGTVPLADRIPATGPGPSEEAREAEAAARLSAAVEKLPVKHRAVFIMARYDGLGYDEIACALRIPVGTVKSRMNKAVGVLLKEMEEFRQ